MSNSLQKHSPHEAHKQLRARMIRDGLDTVKVQVTRRAGKMQIGFTGSKEQVAQAQDILAHWN
jgi:hypothetical protein